MEQEYIYAVARIKARELSLLTQQDLDRLMACKTPAECFRALADKGWGAGGETSAEAIFAAEEEKTWALMHELLPDLTPFSVLLYPIDFNNNQCMAVFTRGPHSYTGEDTVEFHCHGSPAVLAAGLEALYQAGAKPARRGEFTKRAFLNGRMDLTQAEAVIDLIEAETAEAAANAAGQVEGALVRRLEPVYDTLTDLCSHFHAVLDYPDEDIDEFRLTAYASSLASAQATLEALHSFA